MSNQSVLTKIPNNTSFLQPTKFIFTFTTLPFLKYFCQSCTIPGIGTSAVLQENPFSQTWRHGDKLQFDTFDMTVLMDEDLRVWEETYNWFKAIAFPHSNREYWTETNGRQTAYHDGILTVLTNANNPNIRFKMTYCHPISMSALRFSAADNATNIMTCDISFRFDLIEIERLSIT